MGDRDVYSTYSGHKAPCAAESQNLAAVIVQGDRNTASHSHVGSQEDGSKTEAECTHKHGGEKSPVGLAGATLQESKILCE